MDNNNSSSFHPQPFTKPPPAVAPLRLTSRRVTFQPRNFAATVERPRSFRTFPRTQAHSQDYVQPLSDHEHAQPSHDESQAQDVQMSVQTPPDQVRNTKSDHSRHERSVSADGSSRYSSSSSSHSLSSHGQVCSGGGGADSHSSGEQAKHAVNDRLDVLRNMVGMFFYTSCFDLADVCTVLHYIVANFRIEHM